MSTLVLVLRIVLGALLVIFGMNKFIEFIPALEFVNPDAGVFFGALANSYVLKTVGLIEVLVGFLLLINMSVPFALVVLAPISVNIILFHSTLDPKNIGPAVFVFLVNTFLIYTHWDRYKTLF